MKNEKITDPIDQEQEEFAPVLPVWPLSWIWLDETGDEAGSGTGTATATGEALEVAAAGGMPFAVLWHDVSSVEENNHRLTLTLHDGTALVLHKTGRIHDELLLALMEHFDKAMREEALAEETFLAEFNGFASPSGGSGRECRTSVYETALCLTFSSGDVVRIPFVFADIKKNGYLFEVSLSGSAGWTLGKFGRQTDLFGDTVDAALGAMRTRALEFVRTLCPSLPPLQARKLAGFFLDGRAAPQTDILTAPGLWKGLERKLDDAGLGPSWKTLVELDTGQRARIGIKQGLRSGEAYVFFMVPVVYKDRCRIVLEASSDASGSRATYVFNTDASGTEAYGPEEAMDLLNYGMYMVNFRREPIYLSGQQLEKPAYLRYRRALQRIPELSMLRQSFVGRVLHNDGWYANLTKLLFPDATPES